ncbi:MAG TPA: tetratricopeptide repeat protein, partial [Polyangia bacterium]|nr:tetratricopeptide repeat protein [Polyangia bacterium]
MLQILTLTVLLGAAGEPQRPPTPVEQQRFEEGTRALGAGDARGAEKAFRAGYDAGHDPAFLVHVGEAEEKAGAPAEAAETYRRYLREAPDASDRPDIEQRIARLAPSAPAAPPAAAAGAVAATPAAAP